MREPSFVRYELENESEEPVVPTESETSINEMLNNFADLRQKLEEKPDHYKKVEVYLKDGSSFDLKGCQIRIAPDFVYFCETCQKKELAIPIANIQYYLCEGLDNSAEQSKNNDG